MKALIKHLFVSGFLFFGILISHTSLSQTDKTAASSVLVLQISDAIHVGTEEYLDRGFQEAEKQNSAAILIELDTPGGLLESTRKIVQKILASDRKIIVWVNPAGARAASAGSMLTMSAHFAVMAESTSIGAATPVSGDGKEVPADMKAKITNDTLSFVEGIAQKRGRNIEWAKKSVSEAASLSSSAALKEKVIDALANTRPELWTKFREKFPDAPTNPSFQELAMTPKEKVLSFLSNPNVAYGLLALGSLCLYLEISHPGMMVPGVVGVISLAIGAISMKILPVRPGSIALFVIAMILFFIEFMTAVPTHGSAGIGGVIALFLSGLFWMDPAESNVSLNAGFWIPIFLVILGFVVFFLYSSIKALGSQPLQQSSTLMIGKIGKVMKIIDQQSLSVFVDGALWSATLSADSQKQNESFNKGDAIEVVSQNNLKLIIKRKDS